MCDENEDEVDDRRQNMKIIENTTVCNCARNTDFTVGELVAANLSMPELSGIKYYDMCWTGSTPKNAIQLLSQYVTWVWNMLLPQSFPIAASTGTIQTNKFFPVYVQSR